EQEGDFRYVRLSEVLKDEVFVKSIHVRAETAAEHIRDGFERAVARGTLLSVRLHLLKGDEDLYFMNTAKGKATIQAIHEGRWVPGDDLRPIALVVERPNVYRLYEQNIGPLTPMIADQLQDAEQSYSPHRVEE